MDTNQRWRAVATTVTGARHLQAARNGQDAAIAWVGADAAVAVVCDGCSGGASSEVGARLGANLCLTAIVAQLGIGGRPDHTAMWAAVRDAVAGTLAELVERMTGGPIHDYFLFTIGAAVATRDAAAVWMLGDGVYAFDGTTRVQGPFDDNQPPYLAYDLVGDRRPAHLDVAPSTAGSIVIGTDGAAELELARFAGARFVDHPDALRRHLAVLARGDHQIDWDERRVVRTPATLQDDCAIGVVRW